MNLFFLQRHDQYQKFWAKLVKNRQKIIQKHWYLQHWIYTINNIDDYENIYSIYSVNPLYLLVNDASGFIEEKNENRYLIFDATDENKDLLKNIQMFEAELKTKSNH